MQTRQKAPSLFELQARELQLLNARSAACPVSCLEQSSQSVSIVSVQMDAYLQLLVQLPVRHH